MNILVTGSKGFIGSNLMAKLLNEDVENIFECNRDTEDNLLDEYCADADFVFHLAGVNRPGDQTAYMKVNAGLTAALLERLKKNRNKCPVMLASSVQAALDNAYGKSKKAAEDLLFRHKEEWGADVLIYRFPNVFGKWARPGYNSAVATFCYNTARGLPVVLNDPDRLLNLAYIDDVTEELILAMKGNPYRFGEYCKVRQTYFRRLGEIVTLLTFFKETREKLLIPDMSDDFVTKLYSTYMSYLPLDELPYHLQIKEDQKGSFTELIKTGRAGQVSVNKIKPGITKGDHWHHSKVEKFIVVSGKATVRFRKVGEKDIAEYFLNGDPPFAIDIPPGYTHSIENGGAEDLIVVIWSSEEYDPVNPDTFSLKVKGGLDSEKT